MGKVLVPRENVNDKTVIIRKIYYPNNTNINRNDIVMDIETSKTIISIEAPNDGCLKYSVDVNESIDIGELLFIVEDIGEKTVDPKPSLVILDSVNKETKFSKKAIEKAAELNVDLGIFTKKMVTESDVISYANNRVKKTSVKESVSSFTKHFAQRENKIIIIGAGGHAKMCIDILRMRNEYQIAGIVDVNLDVGSRFYGIDVVGCDLDLKEIFCNQASNAVIAVGSANNNIFRSELYLRVKELGFSFPNLVHPSAVVGATVTMGEGNQIMMNSCLGPDVILGNNCIVNSGAIVSHDSIINSSTHIAPGAMLAGSVVVGANSLIGMGALIYMGVEIGENAVVVNGEKAFKNVPSGTIIKSQT